MTDLISGEEVQALRARAKTITMREGLRMTLEGGFVPVIPMELKSGYAVSMTIVDSQIGRDPIELFSVTYKGEAPDAAEADHIAMAVLGKGYDPLPGLFSKKMLHYMKRRE